jgi:amidohydrolase
MVKKMKFIRKKLINMQEFIQTTRRELHLIPEAGFEERKTQQYLMKNLDDLGVEYHLAAGTGLIARLPGEDSTKATAYRTDIDGLGVAEENQHDFISSHDGMMHACGHDGHMTIALGIIRYLVHNQVKLKRDLIVVFQPAEEGPGGAEVIVESGILKQLNVKDIFGYHVFPEVDENRFSSRPGPLMAHTGEFDIDIHTVGAHGAMPHLGVDAAVLAAELLLQIQTIVSRSINPIDPAVITIGRLEIGQKRNVIADHARLEGTVRAFKDEAFYGIRDKLHKYAEMYKDDQVSVNVEFRDMYREVNNDDSLLRCFVDSVGIEIYDESPMQMIAEDFSFYQKEFPGIFVFLGIRNEEKGKVFPLHSPRFDFDEYALLNGIEGYIRYLEKRGIIDGE